MFWELTNELVRHEVAEEEIVYPEVRKVVPNGERLAGARIKEQSKAEELLAKMEKAGTGANEFPSYLQQLQKAVLEHAERGDAGLHASRRGPRRRPTPPAGQPLQQGQGVCSNAPSSECPRYAPRQYGSGAYCCLG